MYGDKERLSFDEFMPLSSHLYGGTPLYDDYPFILILTVLIWFYDSRADYSDYLDIFMLQECVESLATLWSLFVKKVEH